MINKTNNYPVITQYTVMMASSTGKENMNNNNMHKKEKIGSLVGDDKVHNPVNLGSQLRACLMWQAELTCNYLILVLLMF